MICPRCGSQNVSERVIMRCWVMVHHVPGKVPANDLEDFGSVVQVISRECNSCGHFEDDPEVEWNRTPNEVRRDELLDWADRQYDERRM